MGERAISIWTCKAERRAEPRPRWAREERQGMKLEDRMDTLIWAIACAFWCGSAKGQRFSGICNAMHGFTPRSLDVARDVSELTVRSDFVK